MLYPNVGGFGSGGFLKLEEPELMLECVRAYNDFLVEWCSEDADRLVPVAAMPFWSVEESVKEVYRAAEMGHKSILACSDPAAFGEPRLAHAHWDPFWSAVQETGLPISFHIGAGDLSDIVSDPCELGPRAAFSRVSSTIFMQNMSSIADLIFGGRLPSLPGPGPRLRREWRGVVAGPSLKQPTGSGRMARSRRTTRNMTCFRASISGARSTRASGSRTRLCDRRLISSRTTSAGETDFPHPTCMHPGPVNGLAQHPRDYVNRVMGDLDETKVEKVLHSNAAKLYGLD